MNFIIIFKSLLIFRNVEKLSHKIQRTDDPQKLECLCSSQNWLASKLIPMSLRLKSLLHFWLHGFQCYCCYFSTRGTFMDWWKILPSSVKIASLRMANEENGFDWKNLVSTYFRKLSKIVSDWYRFSIDHRSICYWSI